MKVGWAATAEGDLDRIVLYIGQDSPMAALQMQARLVEAAASLARFPQRGRAGRIRGTRELPVIGTPYIMVYKIDPDFAWILHLVHGAQSWPPT